MMIAETRIWQISTYTIQQRARPDNPAWPVYIVLVAGRVIGKSFSIPTLDCCRWLEEHPDGHYAAQSAKPSQYSAGRRGKRNNNALFPEEDS